MGLAEHQAIYALHGNTHNYHLHIAVNRTHPDTCKVVQPHKGFDIREAHKIVALIEKKQGWASEENAMFEVLPDGSIEHRVRREPATFKAKNAAAAFEHLTGQKSAQRIAYERGHEIITTAKTWQELHQKLANEGLRLEKKGSGAVIFVGDTAVKASSVDRAFSLSKLCARLGTFIQRGEAENEELLAILPAPVSTVLHPDWLEYQKELKQSPAPQDEEKLVHKLFELKARQQKEREQAVASLREYGFSILNIARYGLKLRHRNELREFRQHYRKPTQKSHALKRG